MEFLPSFPAKLVPGVDLVPFWTIAVASVYRKSKQIMVTTQCWGILYLRVVGDIFLHSRV